MTKRAGDDRPELKAKAELLEFLRAVGQLSSKSSVTAELILDNYSARADLAVCDRGDLHVYEIKTERDTLGRLDRQLEIYARHADFVTVVAATRHINAIISRVEQHIGIYEMIGFASSDPIRIVREATQSPTFDANALLSLVPAKDLCSRLEMEGRLRRSEVIAGAAGLSVETKKRAVLDFFSERYGPNSRALWRAARRRKFRSSDLSILRRWRQGTEADEKVHVLHVPPQVGPRCPDMEVYMHVGKSFGPMPDDLRALLAG
ncbi:sce7726 family protein [Sphingomonas sp.]|uniref:sce7726 family protein n=1 Tax=Sphingomonas sp. TaxID=28214 RepID=UPI0017E41A30|nr:sce7726 family protein [Sphingomonas sp.]MBA4762903.1 sce7726 family protein [Sphingomonas sp.]